MSFANLIVPQCIGRVGMEAFYAYLRTVPVCLVGKLLPATDAGPGTPASPTRSPNSLVLHVTVSTFRQTPKSKVPQEMASLWRFGE